ncbi:MAG: amino acid ABC transporter permease [Ramlibacter sp.]
MTDLLSALQLDGLVRAWPLLAQGAAVTLGLTVTGAVLGIALGCVLAAMKLYGAPWVRRLATWYVDFFRSIPLILTLFWAFFMLPWALRAITGDPYAQVGPVYAALTAFVMAEAAYYGEIIRGGILAVPSGQRQAALALGMTQRQALAGVVMPQALRHMAPALVTQTIGLLMDTSLVYVISLSDFLGAASKIAQRDGTLVPVYLFVAVTYLGVCTAGSWLAQWLRMRSARLPR